MRKYYLDNLRHFIVLLVVVYHIVFIFNSVGVISNIDVQGIPEMDLLLYFVYPWFMPLMFLISGIGARYSLQKRSRKQFLKERVHKLLIPSVIGVFLYGWMVGYVTNQATDVFAGNGDMIPGFVKFIILSLIGTGPLWFVHELFLGSLVLLLIIGIDKSDKIYSLFDRINILGLIGLAIPVWLSSYILNTPLIEVYRNGIYIFIFLLGYFVFSHDHVQDLLEKYYLPLMGVSLIIGVSYTMINYGDNYTVLEHLKSPFFNVYLWMMSLAVLGTFKKVFNSNTKFTKFMASRSFGIYVLHYPVLVVFAYLLTKYVELPMIVYYFALLITEIIMVPLVYEVINKIPLVRSLVLGK